MGAARYVEEVDPARKLELDLQRQGGERRRRERKKPLGPTQKIAECVETGAAVAAATPTTAEPAPAAPPSPPPPPPPPPKWLEARRTELWANYSPESYKWHEVINDLLDLERPKDTPLHAIHDVATLPTEPPRYVKLMHAFRHAGQGHLAWQLLAAPSSNGICIFVSLS
jgi:hypothetical protein